jgi:FMN phosphatase YigB (HAD superfamily)
MSRLLEIPAGRFPTSHDIVFGMLRSFFRKSGQNMVDLSNIQAVLFDLDGTLIDVDMHRFVPGYLRRLTDQMSAQVNPARATRVLHQAVAAMFANTDADRTLESILCEVLQSELAISPEWYVECLARFCRDDLESLRPLVTGHPLSSQLIESSLARGWKVVLATNPIFPRVVVDARLSWGELDSEAFHHVTAYETAHFCKPSPLFFEEILARLQIPAEACLMVGNDTLHDLSASQVGMQTCLLTPWSIKRPGTCFKADWEGRHVELLALIEKPAKVSAGNLSRLT